MKYKLSRHISVQDTNDADLERLPPEYLNGYFILDNQLKDRQYLINGTVRYFLSKFALPADPDEVMEEVAAEVGGSRADVENTCSTFIRFLTKKRFIIPGDEWEPTPSEEAAYRCGDIIGDQYEVVEVLTNRHSIEVYQVKELATGHLQVIKLLNKAKIPDEKNFVSEKGYLEREYILLRRSAGHAAICQAFDFGDDAAGNAYIVLEWIEGEAIARYVDKHPELSMQELLSLIRSMLEAFACLHRLGTVHGDVHSGNVLVLPDRSVKLIDLGLSINRELEEKQVVKYGGVDYYMPPERINIISVKKFAGEPDLRSDVYQIGLLMYTLLYDDFPFDGFIWEELAAAIKGQEPGFPELSAAGHIVPVPVTELVSTCMQKAPEDRFGDAAALLEAFEQSIIDLKVQQPADA